MEGWVWGRVGIEKEVWKEVLRGRTGRRRWRGGWREAAGRRPPAEMGQKRGDARGVGGGGGGQNRGAAGTGGRSWGSSCVGSTAQARQK